MKKYLPWTRDGLRTGWDSVEVHEEYIYYDQLQTLGKKRSELVWITFNHNFHANDSGSSNALIRNCEQNVVNVIIIIGYYVGRIPWNVLIACMEIFSFECCRRALIYIFVDKTHARGRTFLRNIINNIELQTLEYTYGCKAEHSDEYKSGHFGVGWCIAGFLFYSLLPQSDCHSSFIHES